MLNNNQYNILFYFKKYSKLINSQANFKALKVLILLFYDYYISVFLKLLIKLHTFYSFV